MQRLCALSVPYTVVVMYFPGASKSERQCSSRLYATHVPHRRAKLSQSALATTLVCVNLSICATPKWLALV